MKNKITVEDTREYEVIKSIVCNKCGKTHEADEDNEYLHIHKVDVNFDGERNYYRSRCWMLDLCDDCLVGFVKTFKHTPDWFHGWENNQQEFDKWVDGGCKPYDRF
jgi:hypothetical protein